VDDLSIILLVEDSPDDVELIQYAFDKAGITSPLVVVTDGDQAVDYLAGQGRFADRRHHPLPTLILLDLKLPRRSGFEVLQFLRGEDATRGTPVVVLTSSNQPSDIARAYEAGANSYLVKPVSRGGLLDMVLALDAYWIKLNRVPSA
jgi:CheY-like chemotaxis protein